MSPDQIQAWTIVVTSTATGLVATGTLVYSRWIHARLDSETLTLVHRANAWAIRHHKPVPFPQFLPHDHPA